MSSPPDLSKKALPSGAGAAWQRWLAAPETSVVIVLVALVLLMAWRGLLPQFTSSFNQDSLARSISFLSIAAVGVLLVILTGGIDLSLGSVVAFSGMVLAVTMTRLADGGMPVPQAMAVGVAVVLAAAALLGVLHAALIHYLRLPPFVVTLASMSMLRSGAYLLNNAVPLPIERFEGIRYLANGKLYLAGTPFGIPVPAVILAVVVVVIGGILSFTRIGRRVYSVGSNEEASRLSGVNVFHTRLFAYGTCSLLAALAGILYAGYGGQGDPNSGVMFELNAISAAVIGGAVLTGGRGSVLGTVLGAALLEWILNMINLGLLPIQNTTLWRGMVVGSVLLAAVVLNQVRQIAGARRAAARKAPGAR